MRRSVLARTRACLLVGLTLGACVRVSPRSADTPVDARAAVPLPSWSATPSRDRILAFVAAVTTPGGADYVPPSARVAVFDNDGTLWSEHPFYFQFLFIIDRVRELADAHPEWRDTPPFKFVLENDHDALLASGKEGLMELLMATHAGLTTEEFTDVVRSWTASHRHPRFDRPYTELVYQPMLELLDLLREHEFKVFIVSGGGLDFMRAWVESVYGIPPERVVGSTLGARYELRDGKGVIVKIPEIDFIDDGPGKPVGIQRFIGQRPILAFGNSDGDLEMLQWTRQGNGPSLVGLVHHTDANREWSYDRESKIGHLDRAWDEAQRDGWVIVDMKEDWKVVYPFETPTNAGTEGSAVSD